MFLWSRKVVRTTGSGKFAGGNLLCGFECSIDEIGNSREVFKILDPNLIGQIKHFLRRTVRIVSLVSWVILLQLFTSIERTLWIPGVIGVIEISWPGTRQYLY